MLTDKIQKQYFYLVGVLFAALILRLVFFYGIAPGDPFTYSSSAWEIVQGDWRPTTFYEQTTRWGLSFPIALSYKVFGVTEFSSTLWVMATSLGTVLIAYLLGRYLQGENAGLLAAILLAIFPLEMIYSSQPMADCPLSFWLLLSLYLFVRAESSIRKERRQKLFFLCGLALGFAYATKFVTLLIAPFFLLVLLVRRKIEWGWFWIGVGLFSVLAVEFIIFRQVTGSGLKRLDLILHDQASHAPVTAGRFNVQNSVGLYLYWLFVDFHYVGLSFIFLLFLLLSRIKKYWREKNEILGQCWLLLLWSSTFLIILSLYPVSIKPYIPLYKIEAYMLMFTAPLLVTFAVWLSNCERKTQLRISALLVISSLPLMYLSWESYRAHSDNTRAIYAFAQAHPDRPMYAHRSDQRYLQYFAGFRNNTVYKSFRLPQPTHDVHTSEPINFQHTYVALNQYLLDYHVEDTYPAEITNVPATWREVYRYQRPKNWLRKLIENTAAWLQQYKVIPPEIKQKVDTKFANWSHTKPVIIYATD